MRAISLIFLCLVSLSLFACQRFEEPEDQTGLDKDSHSYSYVSFPESKMKQAAMDVPGVIDVRMEYKDWRNVIMYIVPDEGIRPDEYKKLATAVYDRVSKTAPITPFHVKVIEPDEIDRLKGEPQPQ